MSRAARDSHGTLDGAISFVYFSMEMVDSLSCVSSL